jgi:two-component system, chemotaxis family, CheB/CheR fusion protein
MNSMVDNKFEILLERIKRNRGFDFRGYKRPTLVRRFMKRMRSIGVLDYLDYLDYLEVHPEEFTQLFNTILINVTSFFRDEPAWDYLAKEIIPQIMTGKKTDDKAIRIWSAGCASGEEVYSLTMLLAEAMGASAFTQRVKIYATDADEEALNLARRGVYSEKTLKPVPVELRDKYFKQNGNEYTFRSDLRRPIVFGRHDLVQDAPISRLDLLVCRNTLMYFNSEMQNNILARFHFAIKDDGFLFLGKAEMLLNHPNWFNPVAMTNRIFAKSSQHNLRDRMLARSKSDSEEDATSLATLERLRDHAFETSPLAQVVIDAAGNLVLTNMAACKLFNLAPIDFGRPLKDLELSYRPVELGSMIDKVRRDLIPIKLASVEFPAKGDDPIYLDIDIRPIMENGSLLLGLSITYQEATAIHKLQADLQSSRHALEALGQEIESAHEELETTNEELETTNEELQATNEELETMNEELQATNEELETLNQELGLRTEEINEANTFLQSILTSLRSAVIVLDLEFKLLLWNMRAEDLWGLRAEEVKGKSLYDLDIGLPVEKLPLKAFLDGSENYQELEMPATNRRGKSIQCHIVFTPFWNTTGARVGMVLLVEEI